MGRHRKMLPITTDWKRVAAAHGYQAVVWPCGVLIAAMTSELPSYIGRAERRPECTRDQSRCWNLARKPICVGRDHRHGDFALAVDDLHVKALDAFSDRAVRRLERARTSRRSMLIGMGSRRRSASLAIDLLGGEGVNLGCLFTLCRSPSWLIRRRRGGAVHRNIGSSRLLPASFLGFRS